jgi:acetyl-CoA carboxylase alpha subunit
LARTSAAARAHSRAGLLSIAVLRAPTMGGVLASYASLTDLSIAEPGATIGFAGPRVVEVVTGRPVPADSHTAESAYASGLVDALVARSDQAAWVDLALGVRDQRLPGRPLPAPTASLGEGAWNDVLRARGRGRPSGIDHAARLCDSWVELHGTDPTLRAGLARIGSKRVIVIAHDRYAGIGRQGPAAFALARRAMGLADRLRLPLLSLIDTPGAEPGPAAEAGGVAREIALTLAALSEVTVPTVAVCVGEGGSGGALAIGACDVLLMLEHSVFSVLSPEGAATILARDHTQADRFAELLKLRSFDLASIGVIDGVVAEGDPAVVDKAIIAALDHAVAGDRVRRMDALTARWVRPS